MEIRHNIVLDAAQPNVQCSLMMSTGDVSSHRVVIALRNGVEPVPLENVSGYVHFSKPDSTEVVQSAVVYWDNGTAAGVMTFIVNQQVLTATGRVTCRAVLCGAEGEELYSPVFVIDVASNAALDAPLTSQSEYAALTDAKLEAQAWAEGKKGTVDVIEGQQQYENNAKYYAACAQAAAEDIEGKLEECETWEDGKSAYELAVENGFEGTVVEWLASLVGETGPSGSAGAAGKGISSIAKTGTSGLVDTYTITYSDGTTSTFTVTNGAAGQNGTNGTDGQDGADGKSAYELAVENGFEGTEAEWLASLVGAAGQNGTNGTNGTNGRGISSVAKTGTNGLVDTYTITFTDGTTSTFTVTNGAAGQNGTNGTNGTSAYAAAVAAGYSGTEAQFNAALAGVSGKQDKATVITQSAPTAITLADNTEYYLTNVTSLALTYPSGNFECWLRITTASSGTITVTLPTSTYIGDAPTFDNGQTWELSIKDGVVVAGEVAA